MSQAALPYRVELLRSALLRVKKCSRDAILLGIADDCARVRRRVQDKLSTVPLTWGEPTNYFEATRLWKLQRLFERFAIAYFVHEDERIVFVQDIRPVLGHPLETSSEG